MASTSVHEQNQKEMHHGFGRACHQKHDGLGCATPVFGAPKEHRQKCSTTSIWGTVSYLSTS